MSCAGIVNLLSMQPEDLNGFFAFLTVPPGPPFPEHLHLQKMCGVVWCYTGPEEQAEEVFAPIKDFNSPDLYGIHGHAIPRFAGWH